MSPAGVNDSAREMMAGIAKWYAALKGGLVTTGSADAYVLSTGSSHAALADIGLVLFRANFTNTGTCTLAVDGLTAKTIRSQDGVLVAGAIKQNNLYLVSYNATDDAYDMHTVPNELAYSALTRVSARTSNTILGTADKGYLIQFTSGTFSQTITAAATLANGWWCYYENSGSGVITLDPNGAETINGAASLVVATGESGVLICDGSNFRALRFASTDTSIVEVHTGNGHGSTNTKIRRFTTAMTNSGAAITYADSADNGASFTINTAGLYAITYSDGTGNGLEFGVTVNSAALTTAVGSVPVATRKAYMGITGATAVETQCSCTLRLAAGDIVRPHTDGLLPSTSNKVFFSIAKIGM